MILKYFLIILIILTIFIVFYNLYPNLAKLFVYKENYLADYDKIVWCKCKEYEIFNN